MRIIIRTCTVFFLFGLLLSLVVVVPVLVNEVVHRYRFSPDYDGFDSSRKTDHWPPMPLAQLDNPVSPRSGPVLGYLVDTDGATLTTMTGGQVNPSYTGWPLSIDSRGVAASGAAVRVLRTAGRR